MHTAKGIGQQGRLSNGGSLRDGRSWIDPLSIAMSEKRNKSLCNECIFSEETGVGRVDTADRGFAPRGQAAKLRGLRKLNLKEDSTDAHFRFDRMLAWEITSRND